MSEDESRQAGGTSPVPSRSSRAPFTRRRQFVAVALGAFILVVIVVLVFALREGLKSRSARISVGMPSELVEEILGTPVLTLPRTGGRGYLLVWTDQLWQLDVTTGRDGRVESVGCMPSDSMFRRTMRDFTSLFKNP